MDSKKQNRMIQTTCLNRHVLCVSDKKSGCGCFLSFFVLLFLLHIMPFQSLMAQSIIIEDFKKDYTPKDYDISENPECAILFVYSNKTVEVEANLGIIRKLNDIHLTIYFLPHGTSNVTVSYRDYPSLNYEFPEALKANTIYKMTVSSSKKATKDMESYPKPTFVKSTDIELFDFKKSPQTLMASTFPEFDNTGEACAVIRYSVNNDGFVIEPNMGVVKMIEKPGEIIQYVPQGTKRLTVRNGNYMPIRDYEIPVEIKSKATYDVNLSLSDYAIRRQKASPDHDNYLGIGYNNPELKFSAEGGTRSFTIHCNSSWDISAPSWCKLSSTVGSGTMDVEVSAKHNNTKKMRRGVIGIQSQDITVTINVEQAE